MTRREFIHTTFASGISLALPWQSLAAQKQSSITFGLMADPHQDLMHDVESRLEKFITQAQNQQTDFILQLGDFCHPIEENKKFMDIWNSYAGPKYHVLGNHDMDLATKAQSMKYWDMPNNYYSFDHKGFHFIVLDANYLNKGGVYEDYSNSNFYVDGNLRTWIHPEQLAWLEDDLNKTSLPTLVFSHQSLVSDLWGVKNRTKVQQIFETANDKAGFAKVIACFNGHNHIDTYRELNGIYYIDINSMTYQWLGSKYQCHTRYPKEIYDQYPMIANMAPYKDALFAMVSITDDVLKIEGNRSAYVGPSPDELGLTEAVYGVAFTPHLSNRELKRK